MKRPKSAMGLLEDIAAWGDRVAVYTREMNYETFRTDLKTQDAVIRCLEVIGEAASQLLKLEPDFQVKHPAAALAEAYRARNRTAHGYGSVDIQTVWRTAVDDCPSLVTEIRRVLAARQTGSAET